MQINYIDVIILIIVTILFVCAIIFLSKNKGCSGNCNNCKKAKTHLDEQCKK